MRAVVLAAGRGSRLGPLTSRTPKPLLSLDGDSILEQNLRSLASYGIRNIAINLHYHGEAIRKRVGNGSTFDLNIVYSEERELLGTAGGVRQAEPLLPPTWPLMVLYGDNLIKVDVARMLALHEDRRGAGTIAVHSVQDVRASGAVGLDPEDRITTFVEKAPLAQPVAGWVNAGIYVLEKAVVKAIPVDAPSDFGFDVFPTLLRGGVSLYGYRLGPTEAIYPIDTPELYREANRSFDPH